jgi:hypothetical protein
VNHCGACGRDFGSLRAFDTHRVGLHAYTHADGASMEPPRHDGRRCLSEHELEGAGFARNGRGQWSLARDLARARAFASAKPRTTAQVPLSDLARQHLERCV